ncbi:MAG: hypothetical protein N4A33_07065 [Bacteriovoracaceae bacterium]|nr:hypothetical protein [Bacteriovoracaceae bacterium]
MSNNEITYLKEEITNLENKIKDLTSFIESSLLRISQYENLNDQMIINKTKYNDLNPQKAYEIYSKHNYNFLLLDVSKLNHSLEIEEAIKVELEFLEMNIENLTSIRTPIFIISEKGVRSILACEILSNYGFLNINNISGGHKFWPGHKKTNLKIAA